MTRISPNFTLDELARTSTGEDNTPTTSALVALCALTWNVLQPLRAHIGDPIRITSGYRSLAVNIAVGGSKSSQHVKGEAADIKVDGMNAAKLRDAIIKSGVKFDQLIWYAPSRGGHVHVSYSMGGKQRGQVLHAPDGGGYR